MSWSIAARTNGIVRRHFSISIVLNDGVCISVDARLQLSLLMQPYEYKHCLLRCTLGIQYPFCWVAEIIKTCRSICVISSIWKPTTILLYQLEKIMIYVVPLLMADVVSLVEPVNCYGTFYDHNVVEILIQRGWEYCQLSSKSYLFDGD